MAISPCECHNHGMKKSLPTCIISPSPSLLSSTPMIRQASLPPLSSSLLRLQYPHTLSLSHPPAAPLPLSPPLPSRLLRQLPPQAAAAAHAGVAVHLSHPLPAQQELEHVGVQVRNRCWAVTMCAGSEGVPEKENREKQIEIIRPYCAP